MQNVLIMNCINFFLMNCEIGCFILMIVDQMILEGHFRCDIKTFKIVEQL